MSFDSFDLSFSIRSTEPEVRIVNQKLWVEMIKYVELHKAEWTPGYLVAGMFWQYWGMARKTTFESTKSVCCISETTYRRINARAEENTCYLQN